MDGVCEFISNVTEIGNGSIDATKNNGQLGKIESFIGTQKQSTQKFSYDSIGRLSESKEFKGTDNSLTYKQKFDFDRFGNMYRKAANNGISGQSNPLPFTPIEDADISKSSNRFTTNTTYNEAGMVIADNKFRSMNFSYDANGRQVNATNSTNAINAQTVYDALGNRVATKVNDVWQFVIYDFFRKIVAEYGTQGEGVGGVSYVFQDWQGSVRASINANGFIQARFDFTAFGEEISLNVGLRSIEQGYSGDSTTRQGYGMTEKASSGQNHTWFRKQEQKAGRWTSPDPFNGSIKPENPQSFNRYSYVGGDSVNNIDPTGLVLSVNCVRWTWFEWSIGEDGKEIPGTRHEVGPSFWVCTFTWSRNDSPSPQNERNSPGGLANGGKTNLTAKQDKAKQAKIDECVQDKVSTANQKYVDKQKALLETYDTGVAIATVAVIAVIALCSGTCVVPAMVGYGATVVGLRLKLDIDTNLADKDITTDINAIFKQCVKDVGGKLG